MNNPSVKILVQRAPVGSQVFWCLAMITAIALFLSLLIALWQLGTLGGVVIGFGLACLVDEEITMPLTPTERSALFRQRRKSGHQFPLCSVPRCDRRLLRASTQERLVTLLDGTTVKGCCKYCFAKTIEGRQQNRDKVRRSERRNRE